MDVLPLTGDITKQSDDNSCLILDTRLQCNTLVITYVQIEKKTNALFDR